ncbi:phage portal protein family protein [Acinetobacter sp. ANC 4640]
MAKGKNKDLKSKNQSPQSSGVDLYNHQAELAFINFLTRMPDLDEVLRKAGIARHRLCTLMYDDEIYQCVEKRQGGIESAPFRIEPADTPQAIIINDLFRKWWAELVISAQNARWYGYSVIEAVYDQNALNFDGKNITPYIGWTWIGEKPMEWFDPKNDGRLMLLSNYNDQHVNIECDQQFKHFLTQCKATYKNPYGEALFSRLYWIWFFKTNGLKFWAKYVERFGNPLLVGKGSMDTEKMRDALLQAHASSVIAVSGIEDVTTVGAANNGGAAFEGFDKKFERSIQKLILGQTLTSGTDNTGSRALGAVHKEVQQEKVDADIRMITPTLQAILDALCAVNQWEHHKIIVGEQKPLDSDKADRDVKLKNAGAPLTNQYFQREYGLQDGDLAEVSLQGVTKVSPTFSAVPRNALNFATGKPKLSAQQQEVEELTDGQPPLKLLLPEQIKAVLDDSSTIQDLIFGLSKISPDATAHEFTANLDQALYAADVLGYVFSSEGK